MSKRALITGGAGFIAHHLVSQILKNTDWEVVTLDRLDFSGNLNRLHDVLKDFSPADRARVKVVFHDLKAAVNPLIAADIFRSKAKVFMNRVLINIKCVRVFIQ